MLSLFLTMSDVPAQRNKFEALYTAWHKDMYYAAMAILNDHALSEDALQEAFLYTVKHIEKIGDPLSRSTRAFLVTLAGWQAKKILRERSKEPLTDTEDAISASATEDSYFDQYDETRLASLIQTLPEIYREPLFMRYAWDMRYEEIAKNLGVSSDTARKRVERAKKMLKKMLLDAEERA